MKEIKFGPQKRAAKVVIYGPEGIGKSTLASKFPAPLFIDTEDGTTYLDVMRINMTALDTSWDELVATVLEIAKDNKPKCETIVLDTVDWAEQICLASMLARDKKNGIEDYGYGKGYTYLSESFQRLLTALDVAVEAGLNVVILAHAIQRKVEQPDEMGAYDHWELKLSKKIAPIVKEWADHVFFCNYDVHVVNVDGQGATKGKNKAQGGRRVIYTTHTAVWDAKNRWGLPDKIDMDYKLIGKALGATPPEAPKPKQEEKKEEKKAADPIEKAIEDFNKAQSVDEVPFGPTSEQAAFDEGQRQILLAKLDVDGVDPALFAKFVTDVAKKQPKGTKIEQYTGDFIQSWVLRMYAKIISKIKED